MPISKTDKLQANIKELEALQIKASQAAAQETGIKQLAWLNHYTWLTNQLNELKQKEGK